MPAVIDHTAYPDIIDNIVAHAPVRALVRLRATSRAFKERVHSILCQHVALDLYGFEGFFLHPATGERLPTDPWTVHTVDVRQDPGGHIQLGLLPSLRTLRRIGDGVTSTLGEVPQITTLVDFYDLHEWGLHLIDWYDFGRGTISVRDDKIGDIEYQFPTLQRYVLHLRVDANSARRRCEVVEGKGGIRDFRWGPCDFRPTEGIFGSAQPREFVVVLHVPDSPSVDAVYTTLGAAYCLVSNTVQMLAPNPTITIVGFAELASVELAPATSTSEQEDLDMRLRGFQQLKELAERNEWSGSYGSPRDKDTVPTTRFVSMRAWLDELGDRRELEGVWVGREALPCYVPLG